MRDPGLRSERRAELQVGILVLLALVALVAGIAWISGADLGGDRYRLHAVTPEAEQVSEGSRVFVRGVDVGGVDEVRLEGDRVVVTMDVSSSVSLPVDSRARIRASGFLGSQMIQLLPGSATARLGPGDTLQAVTSPDLQTVATDLGDRAESVLSRTSRLLSDTTLEAVQTGTRDLSTTMREVRGLVQEERAHLQEMIASLQRTSAALDGATSGPELERTVSRLDSLTARLHASSDELAASSRSLASILDKIDTGEGSLGRLVNDTSLYVGVTAAMENLQAASEEIGLLTRDLRERPEHYLGNLDFSVF
ncbi:MAG: MlaD family protein [Gemmatimonadota bacterium]